MSEHVCVCARLFMMKNWRKTGSTSFHTKVQVAVEHKLRDPSEAATTNRQRIGHGGSMIQSPSNLYLLKFVCLKNAGVSKVFPISKSKDLRGWPQHRLWPQSIHKKRGERNI